jgi:FlaA1/EpsC-like NDP-sugar epimerase
MRVVVFGGTGTIGSDLVKKLGLNTEIEVIRVFTNDEHSLYELKQNYDMNDKRFRWILGDIRDYEKVHFATYGVDVVLNCAAIKHVSFSEYNPVEAIKVNVLGVDNIIRSCFRNRVSKFLHISTDKAVEPISVMGATKLLAERLCIINNAKTGYYWDTKISVVRLGNIRESRGSFVPFAKECLKTGKLVPITDPLMKRYFIDLGTATSFIISCLQDMEGGEIFIPKMKEHTIQELVEELAKELNVVDYGVEWIGRKKGEKMNEKLFGNFENVYNRVDGSLVIRDG